MTDYQTIEKLQCDLYATDTVLRYGDYVLVAYHTYDGCKAQIYMFDENPEKTGLSDIECKLDLMANPDTKFDDAGHAIEWAFDFLKTI